MLNFRIKNNRYHIFWGLAIIAIVAIVVLVLFLAKGNNDDMEFVVTENKPPFIIFIPGFKTKNEPDEIYTKHIKAIFPDSKIEVQKWESDLRWPEAVERADLFSKSIVERIERLPENQRKDVVLIGHSLGGRIAIRALAILADNNMRIKRGIFLGAAINDDDSDIEKALKATRMPCINITNKEDYTLRGIYSMGEENDNKPKLKCALGAYGTFVKYPMVALLEHSFSISTAETKKGIVKILEDIRKKTHNHDASQYLKELACLLSSKQYGEYANPVSHIRKASIEKGSWKELDNKNGWCMFQNSCSKQCKIVSPWGNMLLLDDYERVQEYYTLIQNDINRVELTNSVTIVIEAKDKPTKLYPMMIEQWETEAECYGWLLQHERKRVPSEYRIVDNRDFQRMKGSKDDVFKQFESIKLQLAKKDSAECKKLVEEGSK